MPNKVLWDARPTGVALIATTGTLKNLANDGVAVSDHYENGTHLNTHADLLLYLHDFAAAPSAGGYFALHIVYELGTVYGDGEDGDLAGTPNLTALTFIDVFPLKAADEDQTLQLMGIPLWPHDFKVVLVNKSGQAIPNTDGSYLTIFPYCQEVQ
jgi:hypothetical protein